MKRLLWLAFSGIILVVGGCYPATYVEVPGFHGRVIDAESHPVSGATIELTTSGLDHIETATSRRNGTFNRPAVSHLILRWVMFSDTGVFDYSACAVQGIHRSPPKTGVWYRVEDVTSLDLGDLRLQ